MVRTRALGPVAVCGYIAAVVLVAGLLLAAVLPESRLGRIGVIDAGTAFDIPIFRCGAQIVGRADPYTIEPIATCEKQVQHVFHPGQIAPAPQPPYALAVFKPFAGFPENRFAVGWTFVNLALAIVSAGLLARLSGFPALAIFLGLVWGPGFDLLTLGQLSMVVILGVSWAAFELQRDRPVMAACALSLAMMVPHVGLPAFAALFILVPRARVTIVALFIAGLGVSLALSGPAIAREYVSRVLPLQALAEATNSNQYSLTIWMVALGVADNVAVRIGEVQYALFCAISIVLAKRLSERYAEPSLVVALPVALAVIGGPFIHYSETITMWPAALLLAKHAEGKWRIACAVLVALLSTSWRLGAWLKVELLEFASQAYIVWAFVGPMRRGRRFAVTAAILLPVTLLHELVSRATGPFHSYEPGARLFAQLPAMPSLIREAPWGAGLGPMAWGTYIRAHQEFITVHEASAKFGTLATSLLLLLLLARAAYGKARLEMAVSA
jgi:hypothetical protein